MRTTRPRRSRKLSRGFPGEQEARARVEVHGTLPEGLVGVLEGGAVEVRRGMDEQIEPAELADGGLDERAAIVGPGQIGGHGRGAAAEGADLAARRPRPARRTRGSGRRRRRPAPPERQRDGAPDADASSGDEGGLSVERRPGHGARREAAAEATATGPLRTYAAGSAMSFPFSMKAVHSAESAQRCTVDGGHRRREVDPGRQRLRVDGGAEHEDRDRREQRERRGRRGRALEAAQHVEDRAPVGLACTRRPRPSRGARSR